MFSTKRTLSSKVKPKKKFDIVDTGLFNKKVKILGDGIKVNVPKFILFLLILNSNISVPSVS